MSKEQGPSTANQVVSAVRRPGMGKTLAMLSLATIFGVAKGKDPAQASTTSPHQAVTHTAEAFGSQAIRDFQTAPSSEKSSAAGGNNVEIMLLQYPAKNHTGKYVIEASIFKNSRGNVTPQGLNSIIVRESAGGDQPYTFEIARADDNRQWDVDVIEGASRYIYTTGAADPQEGLFALTTGDFTPIAKQAQAILHDASSRVPITKPAPLPFPPPVFTPGE